MEDDASQGDGGETFTLELSPSKMYSLNTILRYNIINMDDPSYAQTSEILAQDVHDVMVSEDFDSAMQDEIERYEEENVTDLSSGSQNNEPSVGHSVQ